MENAKILGNSQEYIYNTFRPSNHRFLLVSRSILIIVDLVVEAFSLFLFSIRILETNIILESTAITGNANEIYSIRLCTFKSQINR